MSRQLLVLALAVCTLQPVAAADEPRFSRHVVPLFSRLGCNSGTCHGAVKGQNGFRLSLFSVDPAMDHESLIREFGGRRLNLQDPAQSLLLLKATGQVPHGGGKRLDAASPEYQLVHQWIARGAPLDPLDQSRIKTLKVTPDRQTIRAGETQALKVQATFANGASEDVTGLCTFEALDKDVATINPSGVITANQVGDTAVVVRYGSEPVMALVLVPREGTPVAHAPGSPNNFIDEHVLAKLKQLNIHPSDLCDDAAFLRRASLDITGSLPTPEEIRAFLADASPDKRAKKIDELLTRPGHAALWATKFSDILKASAFNANFGFEEPAENRRFFEWLRARLAENVPYDELVARILVATSRDGRSQEEWLDEVMALAEENAKNSPDLQVYNRRQTLDLYWQRENATGMKGTLQVAHAFLGLRLECAQCHRHPHDVWKQDDLLSFANFFMRVKASGYPNGKELPAKAAELVAKAKDEPKKISEEIKKLTEKAKDKKTPPDEAAQINQEIQQLQLKQRVLNYGPKRFGTEVRHEGGKGGFASVSSPLGTQKSEKFRLLGDAKPMPVANDQDPRQLVMDWLRRPDNPFFARAIVNRVWAHYFGRGIIDPPDHLSPLNPASNPALLEALAKGFIDNKYDLKWLHRTIAASRTYQTSCTPNETNQSDRKNHSYFYLRRLPAEVLVDAINHATGSQEVYPAKLYLPPGAKAMEVAGVTREGNETASLAFAFQVFGRPLRNAMVQCDCERDTNTTIVQTLYLANHPRVREKIANPDGRVARIVKDLTDDAKRIEEVYLWSVSRLPTKEELQTCLDYLKANDDPQKGLQDVMWSLLNTREFLLNH